MRYFTVVFDDPHHKEPLEPILCEIWYFFGIFGILGAIDHWVKCHKEYYYDKSQQKGDTHIKLISKGEAIKFFELKEKVEDSDWQVCLNNWNDQHPSLSIEFKDIIDDLKQ